MVLLLSNDGEEFSISRETLKISKTINLILEDNQPTDEDEQRIPLLNVGSKALSKIIEYCECYKNENRLELYAPEPFRLNAKNLSSFDVEFVRSLDRNGVLELTMAADFLDIPSLLNLCCESLFRLLFSMAEEPFEDFLSLPLADKCLQIFMKNYFALEKLLDFFALSRKTTQPENLHITDYDYDILFLVRILIDHYDPSYFLPLYKKLVNALQNPTEIADISNIYLYYNFMYRSESSKEKRLANAWNELVNEFDFLKSKPNWDKYRQIKALEAEVLGNPGDIVFWSSAIAFKRKEPWIGGGVDYYAIEFRSAYVKELERTNQNIVQYYVNLRNELRKWNLNDIVEASNNLIDCTIEQVKALRSVKLQMFQLKWLKNAPRIGLQEYHVLTLNLVDILFQINTHECAHLTSLIGAYSHCIFRKTSIYQKNIKWKYQLLWDDPKNQSLLNALNSLFLDLMSQFVNCMIKTTDKFNIPWLRRTKLYLEIILELYDKFFVVVETKLDYYRELSFFAGKLSSLSNYTDFRERVIPIHKDYLRQFNKYVNNLRTVTKNKFTELFKTPLNMPAPKFYFQDYVHTIPYISCLKRSYSKLDQPEYAPLLDVLNSILFPHILECLDGMDNELYQRCDNWIVALFQSITAVHITVESIPKLIKLVSAYGEMVVLEKTEPSLPSIVENSLHFLQRNFQTIPLTHFNYWFQALELFKIALFDATMDQTLAGLHELAAFQLIETQNRGPNLIRFRLLQESIRLYSKGDRFLYVLYYLLAYLQINIHFQSPAYAFHEAIYILESNIEKFRKNPDKYLQFLQNPYFTKYSSFWDEMVTHIFKQTQSRINQSIVNYELGFNKREENIHFAIVLSLSIDSIVFFTLKEEEPKEEDIGEFHILRCWWDILFNISDYTNFFLNTDIPKLTACEIYYRDAYHLVQLLCGKLISRDDFELLLNIIFLLYEKERNKISSVGIKLFECVGKYQRWYAHRYFRDICPLKSANDIHPDFLSYLDQAKNPQETLSLQTNHEEEDRTENIVQSEDIGVSLPPDDSDKDELFKTKKEFISLLSSLAVAYGRCIGVGLSKDDPSFATTQLANRQTALELKQEVREFLEDHPDLIFFDGFDLKDVVDGHLTRLVKMAMNTPAQPTATRRKKLRRTCKK